MSVNFVIIVHTAPAAILRGNEFAFTTFSHLMDSNVPESMAKGHLSRILPRIYSLGLTQMLW